MKMGVKWVQGSQSFSRNSLHSRGHMSSPDSLAQLCSHGPFGARWGAGQTPVLVALLWFSGPFTHVMSSPVHSFP